MSLIHVLVLAAAGAFLWVFFRGTRSFGEMGIRFGALAMMARLLAIIEDQT